MVGEKSIDMKGIQVMKLLLLHHIKARTVECFATVFSFRQHSGTLYVAIDNRLGFQIRIQITLRLSRRCKAWLHPFTLADVENRIIFQQRYRLNLTSIYICCLYELKEKDHRRFLTLFNGVTLVHGLLESYILASLWEQSLVQYTIRFASCTTDCSRGTVPRFAPGNSSMLQGRNNAVGNQLIKISIHGVFLLYTCLICHS